MHWLSGAGYNEEVRRINAKKERAGQYENLKEVAVKNDERYFIVSNDKMCFVIKLSAFRKLSKTARERLYDIAKM